MQRSIGLRCYALTRKRYEMGAFTSDLRAAHSAPCGVLRLARDRDRLSRLPKIFYFSLDSVVFNN